MGSSTKLPYYKIKFYRDVMGITQKQMCSVMGIKQGTLSKLEAGTLTSDKYEKSIVDLFSKWKKERLEALKDQIDYLNSL